MKEIVAKNQVSLGAARGFQLALSGMSYRIFRSSVTIAILGLATAFLVHMLVYGLLAGRTERVAYQELSQAKALGLQITRLNAPDSKSTILRNLADRESARLSEYRAWAGSLAPRLDDAVTSAQRLATVRSSLEGLPPAAHAILLADQTPEEVIEASRAEGRRQVFLQRLAELKGQGLDLELSQVERLYESDLPLLDQVVVAVEASHRAALDRILSRYRPRSIEDLLIQPPPDFAQVLSSEGFVLSGDLPTLSAFAREERDERLVAEFVLEPEARSRLARELNVLPKDVDYAGVAEFATRSGNAEFLSRVLREAGAPSALSGPRVQSLAERYQRRQHLQTVLGERVPEAETGALGLPERLRWLIVLSFIVCVVGVANAMLMSVTERFTEIATIKCLGAMDGFVMMMFVFEAAIQGVIGGVFGMVVGLVLAALRGAVEYGSLFFTSGIFGLDLVLALFISFGLGVVLAAVAAVGPSWVAARLSPMEAMRVE